MSVLRDGAAGAVALAPSRLADMLHRRREGEAVARRSEKMHPESEPLLVQLGPCNDGVAADEFDGGLRVRLVEQGGGGVGGGGVLDKLRLHLVDLLLNLRGMRRGGVSWASEKRERRQSERREARAYHRHGEVVTFAVADVRDEVPERRRGEVSNGKGKRSGTSSSSIRSNGTKLERERRRTRPRTQSRGS